MDNPKDVHLAGGDAAYLVDEQTVRIKESSVPNES